MLGSVSPDGTRGALAKPGARFAFRVIDQDHVELEFVELGDDPTAFYAVFTRKK
jgi:hypothetical protein